MLEAKLMPFDEWKMLYIDSMKESATKGYSFDFAGGVGDDDQPLRMSSIGKCARMQFYERVSNSAVMGMIQHPWQNILGYAGQEIVAMTLRGMGYELFDQETTVNFAGVPGHVDGKLRGLDIPKKKFLVWDNKNRNTFSYADLVKYGLPKADVEMYCQQQGYIAATGAIGALITVVPYDIAAVRSTLKQRKMADPDPWVQRIILEPDQEAQDVVSGRAEMLDIAIEAGLLPNREYEPESGKFPCSHCSFLTRCLADGPTTDYQVTPIPASWSE